MKRKIAELIMELGFRLLPEFESEDYLEELFYGLNVKYLKIKIIPKWQKVAQNGGSKVDVIRAYRECHKVTNGREILYPPLEESKRVVDCYFNSLERERAEKLSAASCN